jgi:hypothetical protein
MNYNENLWNTYTDENQNNIFKGLSNFFYHAAISLGVTSICEAGCNIGNNLASMPRDFSVSGFDLNKHALSITKSRYPDFDFKLGSIVDIPFPDNSFDLVFTRGVLIHIPESDLDKAMSELMRISKKWIFNLEYYGEDEKMIEWKRGDDLLWYRNMKKRWSKHPVELISNTELPLSIDSSKSKFTLVKKNS